MFDQSQPYIKAACCEHSYRYAMIVPPGPLKEIGAVNTAMKICVQCGDAYRSNGACCPIHAEWEALPSVAPRAVREDVRSRWWTMEQMKERDQFLVIDSP